MEKTKNSPETAWRDLAGCRGVFVPKWRSSGVENLFTARVGGVSEGHYASLNLGLHVADEKPLVQENRKILAQALGVPLERLVCCEQVHGTNVFKVSSADAGRGVLDYETAIRETDALITQEEDLYLTLFFADCVPVFFYDPVHRAVGLAHGGWKGAWGRISSAVTAAMGEEFGCRAEDIEAWIGPGIGACCFEIGDDLAEKVAARDGWGEFLSKREDGRTVWDLKETHRRILLESGLKPEHIAVSAECTSCLAPAFFSYRRDGGITGRMAALIGIRPEKE